MACSWATSASICARFSATRVSVSAWIPAASRGIRFGNRWAGGLFLRGLGLQMGDRRGLVAAQPGHLRGIRFAVLVAAQGQLFSPR